MLRLTAHFCRLPRFHRFRTRISSNQARQRRLVVSSVTTTTTTKGLGLRLGTTKSVPLSPRSPRRSVTTTRRMMIRPFASTTTDTGTENSTRTSKGGIETTAVVAVPCSSSSSSPTTVLEMRQEDEENRDDDNDGDDCDSNNDDCDDDDDDDNEINFQTWLENPSALAFAFSETDELATTTTTTTTTSSSTNDNPNHLEHHHHHTTRAPPNDDHTSQQRRQAVYGRIIDLARLVADAAYERNGAMVGAMAQAGGDENAAERWLQGFLVLLTSTDTTTTSNNSSKNKNLLPWWWKDDKQQQQQQHEQQLWCLARNRNGNHFINRCVDHQVLKQTWKHEGYSYALMVADEILTSIIQSSGQSKQNDNLLATPDDDKENNDDDGQPKFFEIHPDAMSKAKAIWGDETLQELCRKTPQEREEEQAMLQVQQAGMGSSSNDGEHWWGLATEDAPEQAYQRFIDAARYGTNRAYEHEQNFIGSFADALDWHELQHKHGSSSNVDKDVSGDESKSDVVEQRSDLSDKDEIYSPTEVGPRATGHFEAFLAETKKANMMPPWWNEQHESAMWRMAADMKGKHFLAYALDKEELAELYEDIGARQKISLLGEAAMLAENAQAANDGAEEGEWEDEGEESGKWEDEGEDSGNFLEELRKEARRGKPLPT